MKIYIIILIDLFFLLIEKYENSTECINKKPVKNKEDCLSMPSDYSDLLVQQEIACCYVSYKSDDEGRIKKCVPLFKTRNGVHMYKEQLKNIGAMSIDINCSSQKVIISLFMLCIVFLFL